MTFKFLGESLFSDALQSFRMALEGGQLEEIHIDAILEHKKSIWRNYERIYAEYWLLEGIKYAIEQKKTSRDIDLNNIKVIIDPYVEKFQ